MMTLWAYVITYKKLGTADLIIVKFEHENFERMSYVRNHFAILNNIGKLMA